VLGVAQLLLIASYTIGLSVVRPGLWADPYGALLKNIPDPGCGRNLDGAAGRAMTAFGYLLLKTAYVVSATVLFGTGIGTAFQMWAANRSGDVRAIAVAARNVVLADWLFTAPSGLAQPATGLAMVLMIGYDPLSSWLLMTYALYAIAALCWFRVVYLQIVVAGLARRCAAAGAKLPPEYYRAMRQWFWLGWPAFLALVGVFWLMVAKPGFW
jgi:uncharacterized membrane protein